jgi:hypothetical protein
MGSLRRAVTALPDVAASLRNTIPSSVEDALRFK